MPLILAFYCIVGGGEPLPDFRRPDSTPPVVSGATSEATCTFSASESPLIDVFASTITTAMVLHNSVSTGTQKIWSDVGPNWWVQTSSSGYVKRVQKILGGAARHSK